jgi:hypothetical protein
MKLIRNNCEYCLNSYETTIKGGSCCRDCKSIAAHYKMSGSQISKNEFYKIRRPPVNFTYINSEETFNRFGYLPTSVNPFTSTPIISNCKFCESTYEITFTNFVRAQFDGCCKGCAQISSSYSRSKSTENFVEFRKKVLASPRNKKKERVHSNIHALVDQEKAPSAGSRQPVLVRCEFCTSEFETRMSRLTSHVPVVACTDCSGLAANYPTQKVDESPREFYLKRRPKINFDVVSEEETEKTFGYKASEVSPFSNRKVMAKCCICGKFKEERMSILCASDFKTSCRESGCFKIRTVNTLREKYGVSSVLDIPSVKESYQKSSIERIVEHSLVNRYKVDFKNQFCIDAGDFQYSFDFFIPSINLLIECQGDYFHGFKENGYSGTPKDSAKTSYVESHTDYKMISIWEHEINLGRVNKILDHHIYKVTEPEIIIDDPSHLSFREIDENAAHEFLSYYHYLGNLGSKSICLGSFFKDELISVCTFAGTTRQGTHKKINLGLPLKDVKELRRFCIKPNVKFGNLASYSMKRFISLYKTINPHVRAVVSFSDSTVEDSGIIYKASGWTKSHDTSPSYHYFDCGSFKMIHKKTVWNIAGRAKMSESDFAIASGLIKVSEMPKSLWYRMI